MDRSTRQVRPVAGVIATAPRITGWGALVFGGLFVGLIVLLVALIVAVF